MEQLLQPLPVAYDPNRLLDALIDKLRLDNDRALAGALRVTARMIENIRGGRAPVGPSMLLWMHEATGISVSELRALMGDRRMKCRLSCTLVKPQ